MPSKIYQQLLEERLAQMHQRKHCVLVGRGTVAIYLALKSLGFSEGKVVVPSTLCLSAVNAVLYAGLTPEFCDVSLRDFNIDADDIERILKAEKDIRAVLLPHLYGHPTDIDRIKELAKMYNVKFIEDAAQALGGSYKGKPLGSFGEFSILSFGHTKILDVGGGGALLFDKREYLEKIRVQMQLLPVKSGDHKRLETIYRQLYYTLAPFVMGSRKLGFLYSSFPPVFRDLYLFRGISPTLIQRIYKGLDGLASLVARRNEHAAYYRTHLTHEKIVHPRYGGDGVYWRYSFLIRGDRQHEIAEAVRLKGVEVSNWYPPVHLFYDSFPPKLKNAEYVGNNIFNLWVDPKCTERDLKKNVRAVLDVLNTYGT